MILVDLPAELRVVILPCFLCEGGANYFLYSTRKTGFKSGLRIGSPTYIRLEKQYITEV